VHFSTSHAHSAADDTPTSNHDMERSAMATVMQNEYRQEDFRREPRRRTLSPRRAILASLILLFTAIAIAGPARAADDTIEWVPERSPHGPMFIVVGLEEQRAQIYRNGVRIGSTPISSGRRSHPTPTGLFSILEKKREHYSNKYNNAPMPNMQRLTWDGIALHAGRLPGYPASHGCIRLPHAMSDKLFGETTKGTLVAVVDSFPDTAVLDMASAPTGGGRDPHTGEAELPSPAAGTFGPVSVVLSTRDAAVVVMRNGVEIGRAPVAMTPGTLAGERLYVGRHGGLWEEKPLTATPIGSPAVEFAAGGLRVDPGFGDTLEKVLVPGTTVLITDKPLGPASAPSSLLAGEFPAGYDAAP
jgi:hypothetical protein